ncbi:Transcriptional regulator MraZ [Phycisphaerae bacterium RAS2]|nr:Transcriptional regulator MraZ [Phycisphaerae bacterium RAS2]
MLFLTGSADHNIDEKNRLAIPSKYRNRLEPDRDGKGFYLTIGLPKSCLRLYTEREFERQAAERRPHLLQPQASTVFNRNFFALAEFVEPDSQGRIVVPERLMRISELPREVVITGAGAFLEIRPRGGFDPEIKEFVEHYDEHYERALKAESGTRRQPDPETESG